jgi:hypothetical protein
MTTSDSQQDTASQGLRVTRQDGPQKQNAAFAMAVDYRGDVTLELDSAESIVCFVFDITTGTVRYMTATGDRNAIDMQRIDAIEFSGKDTASGISFDQWIERYVQRTLDGEDASLHAADEHAS